jgi:hypothetical protein
VRLSDGSPDETILSADEAELLFGQNTPYRRIDFIPIDFALYGFLFHILEAINEILFHIMSLMELSFVYKTFTGRKLLRESQNFHYECRETKGMILSAGCFPAPQAPDAFRHSHSQKRELCNGVSS